MATAQNKTIYEIYREDTLPIINEVRPAAEDLMLYAKSDGTYSKTYAITIKDILTIDLYEDEDTFSSIFEVNYHPSCFEESEYMDLSVNVIWQGLDDGEEPPVDSLDFTIYWKTEEQSTETNSQVITVEGDGSTNWSWYDSGNEFPHFKDANTQTGEYDYTIELKSIIPEGYNMTINKSPDSTNEDITFNATITKK